MLKFLNYLGLFLKSLSRGEVYYERDKTFFEE